MEALLALLALAVVFGPIVLSIVAIVRANRAADELQRLSRALAALAARIDRLASTPAAGPEIGAAETAEATGPVEAPPADQAAAAEPTAPAEAPAEPAAAFEAPPPPPPPSPPPTPAGPGGGFEKTIAAKWLVWLGAVTVALGATFLVKHSIERGWLGPAMRDLLGFAFGIVLVLAGEWLRRRPLQRALSALGPNYVPPALSAAGLFTVFASIYAAYGLHGLIEPLPAFIALAATAFVAVGLSLLQGPLVAVLGVIGGFVTPMLVSSDAPSAWTLFPYLLALTVAALAVLRYCRWWWLGYGALIGAGFWPLLWFAMAWQPGDALPLGLYLLATLAAFFYFSRDLAESPWESALDAITGDVLLRPGAVAWAAVAAGLLLFFAYVRTAEYATTALVFLGLACLLYLFVGRREAALDALAPAAGALVLALIATWHLPSVIDLTQGFYGLQRQPYEALLGPLLPLELLPFATTAAIFAALFGIAGFVTLWGARRPVIWASASASIPVLLFTIAYWRFVDFGLDIRWAVVALALAAIALAATTRVARYREAPGMDEALGYYAGAVTAFVALGAAMTLREAWLTIAYAAQLLALAVIYERLPVRSLRWVALAAAAVVLVRLVLNWNVLDYGGGASPSLWVLYGYGLPALCFFLAARRFRRGGDDLLVVALEAGWIAFVVLLASFEIRALTGGSLTSGYYDLLEQSLQSAAWLAIAYGLMLGHLREARPVLIAASCILMSAAMLQVILLQVLVSNPLNSGDFVGSYPVINLLFLAYAVPAIFAFLFLAALRRLGWNGIALVAAGFGFALTFIYLTFEVRRAFQGPVLDWSPAADAELYAYSAAWLVYALVLLALAIYLQRASLRYASLIALSLTVLKVFLVDTADLTGLYRVASFFGLGLSLIAIGYVYQRFVFPPRAPTAPPAAGPA